MDQIQEFSAALLSIGHSNQKLEVFVDLLLRHHIQVLVDVRSHPRSKFSPQFDMGPLRKAVQEAGVKYLYLGKELGGRPDNEDFYDPEGHVLYSRVAESSFFLKGLQRLQFGAQKYRVALMCSEENPTFCHRRLLIGRVLAQRGFTVDHIRGDGRLQTEAALVEDQRSGQSGGQDSFFDVQQEKAWRSTQSVLRKGRPRTSSAH